MITKVEQNFEVHTPSYSYKIEILSVKGDILHRSDFSLIKTKVGDTLKVVGRVIGAPERTYTMPFMYGAYSYFLKDVDIKEDGSFEVELSFPFNGSYRFSEEEANRHIPENTFKVNTVYIDVV